MKLRQKFIDACKDGDLDKVKLYLQSPRIDATLYSSKGLMEAAKNGHLKVVKYLLASPDLAIHADLHANHEHALRVACKAGHTSIVEYLLYSPELSSHADAHILESRCIVLAVWGNHIDIIKILAEKEKLNCQDGFKQSAIRNNVALLEYFLTTPKLRVDIHYENDSALNRACYFYAYDAVKFLLYSPKITEHANINCSNNELFYRYCGTSEYCAHIAKILINDPAFAASEEVQSIMFTYAYEEKNMPLLHTLIMEKNIPEHFIQQITKVSVIHQDVLNIFANRNLHDELQQTLPITTNVNKRAKL